MDAAVLAPSPKRPISAWVLVVVLAGLVVVFAGGTARLGWLLLTHQLEVLDTPRAVFAVAWRVALTIASALTLYGVFTRRAWGRWLGLVAIVALGAYVALAPDTAPYPNEAQESGAWLARLVLVPVLYVWWAYAFAFSRKASVYFSSEDQRAV